jgi:hypothetical protein
LGTTHSAGFETSRVRKSQQVSTQLDRTRVIKTLKDLNARFRESERARHGPYPAAVRVDVSSEIDEKIPSRAIACVEVDRRKAPGNTGINKSGKRVQRIELVAAVGDQRATKERI